MKNFIFKSNASDLQKMFQQIETIQKNIVYITYKVDTILKICKEEQTDKSLQKQVDDYFDDESQPNTPPSEDKQDID